MDNTDKKFYTAKTDRVFKTILCNEDNKELMQKFLSRILERKVEIIEFLPNDLPILSVEERVKIVDALVKVDNEYIHIEMNSSNPDYLHNRNFIFFSTIFDIKTKRNEKYDLVTKFIHLDFTYGMVNEKSKEEQDYYEYYMQTSNGKKYLENFKIIEYNMDKIMKYWYTKNKQMVNKYKHLIMLDLNKNDLKELSKGDEMIMEFKEKLVDLNERETFHSAMTYEEDQKLILNTEKSMSFNEGIERGIEQGIEQGISQSKIEIAKNMIKNKINLKTVSACTNLPISKLKTLM